MSNIFSSFNPMTSMLFSLNWLAMMFIPMLISNSLWMKKTPIESAMMNLINNIKTQFMSIMPKSQYHNILIIMSIFQTILFMNIVGMMPFIFPLSSHLVVNLSIGLTMWLSIMIMKFKSFKKLMINLIPNSSPILLSPFMVIIESISMLIQPITLSIRLTANITAGHVLMNLLIMMYNHSILTIIPHITLTMMEMCISAIQAYVFSMLISMYMK